jgi:hypothetical protein
MEIHVHPTLYATLKNAGSKRPMLRACEDQMSTLVLGSSHGDYGFDPQYFPGSFNLCSASQDLRHAHLIYRGLAARCTNLRNLVLYYSVFSSGWNLARNPGEKYASAGLNELFGLGFDYEDAELQAEFLKIKGRLASVNFESAGYSGFITEADRFFFSDDYGAKRRAEDHLRWARLSAENFHLIKLILLAKRCNHKLCIVVPPVRADYREALGARFETIFQPLLEILSDYDFGVDIQLLNAFDCEGFDASVFGDFDHLLPLGRGTALLTTMVRAAVEGRDAPCQ